MLVTVIIYVVRQKFENLKMRLVATMYKNDNGSPHGESKCLKPELFSLFSYSILKKIRSLNKSRYKKHVD